MRVLLLIVLVACGAKSPRQSAVSRPSGPVLYDRLGRMDAIKGIVKDFVEEGLMKGQLATRFAKTDAAALEDSLARQLCEWSGGPCKYVGRSLREVHASLQVTDAEFAAFVAAFEQTLAKFKVDAAEHSELVTLLRKQHADVVTP